MQNLHRKITRNLLIFFSNSSFIDKYIYFLIIKTQYQKRNLQFERFNSLQI